MSSNFQTLLQRAVSGDRQGCLDIIPLISSIELNTCIDDKHNTIIIKACEYQDVDIVKKLLLFGGNPNVVNIQGNSCWEIASLANDYPILHCLSTFITPQSNSKAISTLLKSLPVYSSFHENKTLELLDCIYQSESEIWIELCNNCGESYLHTVIKKGYLQIAKYFVENGGRHYVFHIDDDGRSPLQLVESKYCEKMKRIRRNWSFDVEKRTRFDYDQDEGEEDEDEDDEEEEEEEEDCDSDAENSQGIKTSRSSASISITSRDGASPESPAIARVGQWRGGRGRGRGRGDNHGHGDSDCDSDDDGDSSGARSEDTEDEAGAGEGGGACSRSDTSERHVEVADHVELICKLAQLMGLESALSTPFGLGHYKSRKLLVRHCGIIPLIEQMSRDFVSNQWPKESVSSGAGEAVTAKAKEIEEFGKSHEFIDYGFGSSDMDIGPIMHVLVVAAEMYCRLARPLNSQKFKQLFGGHSFSEKGIRSVIWCLLSMHTLCSSKVMRAWAEIIQRLTNCASASASDVNMSSSNGGTARVVLDLRSDPLPGLSHPAVVSLCLSRMNELGYGLLYHITGQYVDDSGDIMEDFEYDIFSGLLDLFLHVVVPRLPAIAGVLQANSYRQGKSKKTGTFTAGANGGGGAKRKSRRGVVVASKAPTESSGVQEAPTAVDAIQNSNKIASFGVGVVTAGLMRQSQRPLMPGEVGDSPKKKIHVSLLRQVCMMLDYEEDMAQFFTSLQHLVSLIFAPIDHAPHRLAVLVKAMFVWYLVDEASQSMPDAVPGKEQSRHGKETWNSVLHMLSLCFSYEEKSYRHFRRRLNEHKHGRVAEAHSPVACMTNGKYVKKLPALFYEVSREIRMGLKHLIDSSEDMLSQHLEFLLVAPDIVDADQKLEYVIGVMSDWETDDMDDGREPWGETEIHLNRFCSPSVWVESVLQQLLTRESPMYRTSLVVAYDMEAGIGPGPINEFFEISRVIFGVNGITREPFLALDGTKGKNDCITGQRPLDDAKGLGLGLADMAHAFQESLEQAVIETVTSRRHGLLTPNGDGDASSSRPKSRRNAVLDVPLSSMLPLFRPAGDAYPNCVLPIEIGDIVRRVVGASEWDIAKGKVATGAPKDGTEDPSLSHSHSQLRSSKALVSTCVGVVKKLFECVGILIGLALRNQCVLGVGLPPYIWTILISDKEVPRHGYSYFAWQELCGSDAAMVRSCNYILRANEKQLDELSLNFVGSKPSWSKAAEGDNSFRMTLEECPLIPKGDGVRLNLSNRKQYIDKLCRLRMLSSDMEQSIQSIRAGLLRVIPQSLLSLLVPRHLGEYVQGDVGVTVQALRDEVRYEGSYHENHRVVKLFWHMLDDFESSDLSKLLLFWTGNSVLHKNLEMEEEMTISKMSRYKVSAAGSGVLPEASTCDKHLYLPEYASLDEMRRSVRSAIEYSSLGFDRP